MSSTLDTQHDLAVEKASARAAPPPMYQVLLLNDDYTPMEFVVKVLQKFFNKNHEEATRIDRARQRGLAQVQAARRARDVAFFEDGDKGLELTAIHKFSRLLRKE